MNVSFRVNGIPKAQPRMKAYNKGRHAGVYDPGTANDWKSLVQIKAYENKLKKTLTGPLRLSLCFWMPRPKAHYRTGKYSEYLKDNAPMWHSSKPDCDNLKKAVMDAITATGCIWHDDCQVANSITTKFYTSTHGSMKPGVEVYISSLDVESS